MNKRNSQIIFLLSMTALFLASCDTELPSAIEGNMTLVNGVCYAEVLTELSHVRVYPIVRSSNGGFPPATQSSDFNERKVWLYKPEVESSKCPDFVGVGVHQSGSEAVTDYIQEQVTKEGLITFVLKNKEH